MFSFGLNIYIFLCNGTAASRGHCNASAASYLVSCELRVSSNELVIMMGVGVGCPVISGTPWEAAVPGDSAVIR